MDERLIWIIAGTSDARLMIGKLLQQGVRVCASVATEYGQNLLAEEYPKLQIVCKRMQCEEMSAFIRTHRPSAVIDATHPYAQFVTQNISQACADTQTKFYRLYRPESYCWGHITHMRDTAAAVEFLQHTDGKIFVTTGSKELQAFCQLTDYHGRVYARILPMLDGLDKALQLGFSPSQIICMQGPFSKELNIAMLRSSGAKYLVTKNSGTSGGFSEKLAAAEQLGVQVIVIGRPPDVQGLSPEEIWEQLQ